MKNIIKGISGLFLLVVLFTACSPDSYDHPSESGVPKISDINIKITVGAENVVTFEIENKEVVPVWYFPGDDEPVFGNLYKKTFGKSGTYSVEVKVYNSNGISDGSVVKEFTLTESLLTQDLLYISGGTSKRWIMDKATPGHIGCGAGVDVGGDGNGLDWWSAAPNEKAGTALYDDILTFTSDYEYIYDPGPDGMVYVHESAPYKPEYATGNGDYDAPAEKMETAFDFATQGEELYLVFPKNTIVSFIPNSQALDNPRYRIIELSENVLEFCIYNNLSEWSGIIWHYRFIPYED